MKSEFEDIARVYLDTDCPGVQEIIRVLKEKYWKLPKTKKNKEALKREAFQERMKHFAVCFRCQFFCEGELKRSAEK